MSRKVESLLAVVIACFFLAGIHFYFASPSTVTVPPSPIISAATVDVASSSDYNISLTDPLTQYDPLEHTSPTLTFAPHIEQLIADGQYLEARAELMAKAEAAVSSNDPNALANALTLLGMAALAEPDLDAAELYFLEALDVFHEQDDSVGAAKVYMQIGHLHVLSRERARRAAHAYDALLVARWNLSQGNFYAAQASLQEIIESNIALQRYGAAASASESLIRAWRGVGDNWQAEQAALQAIRLYATSGQEYLATRLLTTLLDNNATTPASHVDSQALQDEVNHLLTTFELSVNQIERARDYRRLFNHYRAKGNETRAWKFRLLASQSLAGVSKRAMYHRQPDVLVTLYQSNRSMQLARRSLDEAHGLFQSNGSEEGMQAVQQLQSQIW